MIGTVNPNGIWFGRPEDRPKSHKSQVVLGLANIRNAWTVIVQIFEVPQDAIDRIEAKFCVVKHSEKRVYVLNLVRVMRQNGEPQLDLIVPCEHVDKVVRASKEFDSDLFWLSIVAGETELFRIPGQDLVPALSKLEEQLKQATKADKK